MRLPIRERCGRRRSRQSLVIIRTRKYEINGNTVNEIVAFNKTILSGVKNNTVSGGNLME